MNHTQSSTRFSVAEQMPEGPECTQIALGLNAQLAGKNITALAAIGGRFIRLPPKNLDAILFPLAVERVYCKGKLITFLLTDASQLPIHAFSTLGMTGQWLLEPNAYAALQLDYLSPGEAEVKSLYYCDARRFGCFGFETDAIRAKKRLDSIAAGFVGEVIITQDAFLAAIVKCKSKPLLRSLMDQHSICSSIGNYLVAEILYACRLYPDVLCSELSMEQRLNLFTQCQQIITASYEKGGVSIRDYKHVSGARGEYGPLLKVYDKKVDPLGNEVYRSLGNHDRTIHWVPALQMSD